MADTTFVPGTVVTSTWLNDVNRTVYRNVINVRNAPYNAVGDGVTDDQPAITAALNAAIAAGVPTTIYFPTAKYKCNAVLGVFNGSDITVDFNNSTLDFSSISVASTSSILIFQGLYGTPVTITSTATENQSTVACVSSGFVKGDLVRIYSNEEFDPLRTGSRIGELNFIDTVPDGASVTTTSPLQDTYFTADSAKIEKLTPVRNIVIKNGTFLGPGGNDELRGWRFRVAVNCRAEGMRTFDIDYYHAQITDAIFCTVNNCYFEEANNAGTAYGLSFADACQDCIAYGNHFVNVRHSLSTNNTSISWGVVRRIRFELNNVYDSATALAGTGGDAIDTHAAAEDIIIVNNTVHQSSGIGINIEARSAFVSGNWIKHTASVGIYFHPFSTSTPNVTITNNRLDRIGNGSGTDAGIWVVAGGTVSPDRVTITGNFVDSATSEAVRVTGIIGGDKARNITITGNTLRSEGLERALFLRDVLNATISGNNIIATIADHALVCENCSIIGIGSNVIEIQGAAAEGWGVRFLGTGSRNNITGNLIAADSGFVASYGVTFADTITSSVVYCNTFPGITTDVQLGAGAGNLQANNA